MRKALTKPAFKKRWIKDLIFCTAVYFILLNIFASSSKWTMIDHIYTSIFLGSLILFGTINEWVIQRRFLVKDKYVLFVLITLLNILVGAWFNAFLFNTLIDYVLPGYYFISYYTYLDLVKFFFGYIFLLTLLGLSWEWFSLKEATHRMTLLEKQKVTAELKALTNQVNPHFLFNSLNLLYGLALKNSTQTAPAVMKLSEILRYSIYDTARGKVKLESEIKLIQNYIELQRLRMKQGGEISFNHEVLNPDMEIEPMLFMPIVENAFKHGLMTVADKGFVKIDLFGQNGNIELVVSNNKAANVPSVENAGGIGLSNIEERLKLVYPNKSELAVTDSGSIFSVSLRLTLV